MTSSLRDATVIVLDCQATGASPKHGHLLELAWLTMRSSVLPDPAAIVASCVALPEGATIPPIVRELTGITDADMLDVPPAAALCRIDCSRC